MIGNLAVALVLTAETPVKGDRSENLYARFERRG